LAFTIAPAIRAFSASNLNNGYTRPNKTVNGWVGHWNEEVSRVSMQWDESQTISNITLMFDTDFDHAMESTLRGHPERVMPFCVRSYRILDNNGEVIYEKEDNYQTINIIELEETVTTDELIIEIERPGPDVAP